MLKYLLAATLAALFFVPPANAQESQCPEVSTANGYDHMTIFINGIRNTQRQACDSLSVLRQLTDADAEQSDFRLFYNPTNGLIADPLELRLQAQISDRAYDIAQNDSTILLRGASARYNFVLGKLYVERIENDVYETEVEREVYLRTNALYVYLSGRVSDGKSVTVVAHSQGNFYIEAAIAIMRSRGENDVADRIRVVGVAPVSSSTPSDVYVSLEGDKAIGAHRRSTSNLRYFNVLPANARGCISTYIGRCDAFAKISEEEWMMHGFTNVYLNPNVLVDGITLRNRIRDQVFRSRNILSGILVESTTAETPRLQTQTGLPYTVVSAARWSRGVFGIMFRAQEPSTDVSRYIWDFGRGSTQSSASPTVSNTFNPNGTYTVTLTVIFRNGRSTVCTKTFIMDDDFSSRRYDSRQNQTPCE